MKVIDATNESIREYCNKVVVAMRADLTPCRNLVVAVESGGSPIADELANGIHTHGLSCKLASIRCQRPSSKAKKNAGSGRLFKTLLQCLPKPVLNLLRVIEHQVLSRKRNPEREIVTDFDDFDSFDNIILVDDAIDSGYSLKKVIDYLRVKAPVARIITVVYVVTQKQPVVEPDYLNLRNVLVRFPWASDA